MHITSTRLLWNPRDSCEKWNDKVRLNATPHHQSIRNGRPGGRIPRVDSYSQGTNNTDKLLQDPRHPCRCLVIK